MGLGRHILKGDPTGDFTCVGAVELPISVTGGENAILRKYLGGCSGCSFAGMPAAMAASVAASGDAIGDATGDASGVPGNASYA